MHTVHKYRVRQNGNGAEHSTETRTQHTQRNHTYERMHVRIPHTHTTHLSTDHQDIIIFKKMNYYKLGPLEFRLTWMSKFPDRFQQFHFRENVR